MIGLVILLHDASRQEATAKQQELIVGIYAGPISY